MNDQVYPLGAEGQMFERKKNTAWEEREKKYFSIYYSPLTLQNFFLENFCSVRTLLLTLYGKF